MAKGQNDPTGGNDYLEQLQWRSRYRGRWSVRFEPKWKYKIVYRYPQTTLYGKVLQFLLLIGAIFFAKSAITRILTETTMELPGKIFFGFVVGLIVTILFFAIRDGSKDSDDNSKKLDS